MADLIVEQCLPSSRAAEIQALFTRVGRPEFSAVYQRAYRVRERSGLRSWIGKSGLQAVLHISVSPQTFSDGSRTMVVGLLGDLMADDSQRDFWGPVRLARQMVADTRSGNQIDLLLTTYLPAAEPVFKACGFKPLGVMRRHVLPLYRPYLLFRRLAAGSSQARMASLPFGDGGADALLHALKSPGLFRPVPSAEFYATHMPRQDYPAGTWIVAGDAGGEPQGMALLSPLSPREIVVADLLWRNADVSIPRLLLAAATWAHQSAYRRLTLYAIEGSALSTGARGAGFLPRADTQGLMAQPLRSDLALPELRDWAMMPFAGTAW